MRTFLYCNTKICEGILNRGFFTYLKSGCIFLTSKTNRVSDFVYQVPEDSGQQKSKKNRKFTQENEYKYSKSVGAKQKNAQQNIAKHTVSKYDNEMSVENMTKSEQVRSEIGVERNREKKNDRMQKKKKFVVKDVISDHDLQTKINSMLKYIEKGKIVSCEIFSSGEENKIDKVMKLLNNSVLKEYILSSNTFKNRSSITYEKKVTDKMSEETKK